jgi:hypothetical protein
MFRKKDTLYGKPLILLRANIQRGLEMDFRLDNFMVVVYILIERLEEQNWRCDMADLFELPDELRIEEEVRGGRRGKIVRFIQELLSLSGFHVVIDGDFGPATECAVRFFQKENGLTIDGVVSGDTVARLLDPMKQAIKEMVDDGRTVAEWMVAYGRQHLSVHPREVGGQNRGPWVRLYMKGNDGAQWPWCAGFVSYILGQACQTVGCKLPFHTSFSCDRLAHNAMDKELFIRGNKEENQAKVKPGTIFLNRRSSIDWVHTGIVVDVDLAHGCFRSIEGNTNDEGSREGYEVCMRTRSFKDKDFILI